MALVGNGSDIIAGDRIGIVGRNVTITSGKKSIQDARHDQAAPFLTPPPTQEMD